MPVPLRILLDQNVPREVAIWLRDARPSWTIEHTNDVGLSTKADVEIFAWAQAHGAIVITYDEDFADRRSFPVGEHAGVVRLRVWPTTVEETLRALKRLLAAVADEELAGALVIVDRGQIRIRAARR